MPTVDVLNERERRVLEAVIQTYIETAEPAGSQTIARRYPLGLSPASIRSTMGELEAKGFLFHTHSSSGRIPTDQAYRVYVNDLMRLAPPSDRERETLRRELHLERDAIEEIRPGNTTDVKTLLPIVARLQQRFRVREMCVLADRGMISDQVMASLEYLDPPVHYILGARMRRQKEVSECVLTQRGAWREVYPERVQSKDPAPLKVREVRVQGRRYIVCLNTEERRHDAQSRAAIVEHLRAQLRRGDKSLVGNKGDRRFLKATGKNRFEVDEAQVKQDARFDGPRRGAGSIGTGCSRSGNPGRSKTRSGRCKTKE